MPLFYRLVLISMCSGFIAVGVYILGFELFPARANYIVFSREFGALNCLSAHIQSFWDIGAQAQWGSCKNTLMKHGILWQTWLRLYALELSTLIAFVSGLWAYLSHSVSTPQTSRVTSGGRLLDGREALRVFQSSFKQQVKQDGQGAELAEGVNLSLKHELRHFLIRGGTGSGKTQVMLRLVSGWIEKQEPVIVLDLKGALTSTLGSCEGPTKPILLSPGDARSHEWLIGYDCTDEADAHELASHLIPKSEKNSFFSKAAQNILVAVILKLQAEKPRKWSWRDLYAHVCLKPEELGAICKRYFPQSAILFEGDSRSSTMDVLSTLSTNLVTVRLLAHTWGRYTPKFAMRHWLKTGKTKQRLVILGWSEKSREVSASWVAAFSSLMGSYIASPDMPESDVKSVNLALDEFGNLPKMPGLASAINMGRSKGLSTALVIQDIGQLKQVYGSDVANGWLSTIGNHIVCRLGPGPSNEEVSRSAGEQEIEELQVTENSSANGNSTSKQWVKKSRPVIKPNELLSKLQVTETGYSFLLFGIDANAYIFWNNFITLPKLRKAYVPLKRVKPKQAPKRPAPQNQTKTKAPQLKTEKLERLLNKKQPQRV
ncbi:type IV secretion system DNA-binding domain-containing protein [Pseudovibrio denitrificans]|uniref:type IV secretion system DNA-binding domain-containing protein n=1 Tax=Pseudovibrio denitrificans TaxID=258256 RepID=UPI0039BF6418